jgi:hypothetical protein
MKKIKPRYGKGVPRKRDDIVELIIAELRPRDKALATKAVLSWLERIKLQGNDLHNSFGRAQVKRAARRISKAIATLQRELASSPERIVLEMFLPKILELGSPKIGGGIEHVRYRIGALDSQLQRMRAVCDEQVRSPDGFAKNSDPVQLLCAHGAYTLMSELSPVRITGTSGGPFETIAGLLYETARKREADLKRPCSLVLRALRHKGTETD